MGALSRVAARRLAAGPGGVAAGAGVARRDGRGGGAAHRAVRRSARHDRRRRGAAARRGRDLGATMVFTEVTHLRELERMRDQFITVAAHELRTPLTTLLGYAQMLGRRLRGDAPREQIEATAENITRAGRRLDILVNQLVDVSRLERGSLPLLRKPCNL